MRILLIHNHYRSAAPSGENAVFAAEAAMLKRHGHDVETFCRHSDELQRQGWLGSLRGALATPWNPWMASAIRHRTLIMQPDVAHAHNTFPLLSPAIFGAIAHGCARVLTLHNYRLYCPAAIPMRDGRICTECMDDHAVLPALIHGCYRGSRLATLPIAASVALHRRLGTWQRHIDAFIALSEFQRTQLVAAGLPSELVHVKPNFEADAPPPVPWPERKERVVFVGRLGTEKGILPLLEAWARWGDAAPELRLIGDGPLRHEIESRAATLPGRITVTGPLAPEAAHREIAQARLLVLPSLWFEGFPMVIAEAFARGTPAAVSAIGGLPEIVRGGDNGIVFPPGNPAALLAAIHASWSAPGRLEALGAGARRSHDERYSEPRNHERLLEIYAAARAVRAGRDTR